MASDDPLDEVIELLNKPGEYARTYGRTVTEDEMVFQPLVRSIRLLVGEVQSLRDEVQELRGE